jgi:hypothetical protein
MNPLQYQNLLKANILSCYSNSNDIMKSGEGSKGGKVIGHTKSGKPIYDAHNHSSHSSFTKKDHFDAYSLHSEKGAEVLKKRKNIKVAEKRETMMDVAAHHSIQEEEHYKKYLELPESDSAIEDDDDEEIYQRKQKEKRDKENAGKYSPDDVLELKSPNTDAVSNVSFRGYHDGKAVVFDKKTGNQFSVPTDWLKKK